MIEAIAYLFIVVGTLSVLALYTVSEFLLAVLFVAIMFLLVRALGAHR